ncbi:hypothetical protein BDV38DRAFT_234401 [Aspergillus pseudotamarii]|uniref:Uncharacterized protein n=1 Tax=Aspergillus pseudotamarii TaxID=132259 RepID=A0A5N6T9M7_ASPPS|nr:uncharacterized protein BDV38DRAFT_234401 [Aspergillus pseudotamarii]KAE8143013.1 hypothetical protein BDV38DRAFT_234401 [Aspergillus pseudotamarii]
MKALSCLAGANAGFLLTYLWVHRESASYIGVVMASMSISEPVGFLPLFPHRSRKIKPSYATGMGRHLGFFIRRDVAFR